MSNLPAPESFPGIFGSALRKFRGTTVWGSCIDRRTVRLQDSTPGYPFDSLPLNEIGDCDVTLRTHSQTTRILRMRELTRHALAQTYAYERAYAQAYVSVTVRDGYDPTSHKSEFAFASEEIECFVYAGIIFAGNFDGAKVCVSSRQDPVSWFEAKNNQTCLSSIHPFTVAWWEQHLGLWRHQSASNLSEVSGCFLYWIRWRYSSRAASKRYSRCMTPSRDNGRTALQRILEAAQGQTCAQILGIPRIFVHNSRLFCGGDAIL